MKKLPPHIRETLLRSRENLAVWLLRTTPVSAERERALQAIRRYRSVRDGNIGTIEEIKEIDEFMSLHEPEYKPKTPINELLKQL